MRVGWLVDQVDTVGGAELTQAEFRAATPEDVEIVDCPPGNVPEGLDHYVVHNCVSYQLADIWPAEGRTVKYVHDVMPHVAPEVRDALLKETVVCCSPLQADRMGLDQASHIPPPVGLDRFRAAASENGTERRGAVAVGPWMNPGKAPHLAAEWAAGNGGIEFFGGGPFAPPGSIQVSHEDVPSILARYKTFVHLPNVLEPFGRTTVEAWAAGCELVINRLVGARYWIEENPKGLETAAEDFWKVVLDV